MANLSVERMSGEVCTVAVRPDTTIGELREKLKAQIFGFAKKIERRN